MEKLMSLKDAQALVAGSVERKSELIESMNKIITNQAQRGLRWAHLPTESTDKEKDWLKDELVLNGFKVTTSDPAVNW